MHKTLVDFGGRGWQDYLYGCESRGQNPVRGVVSGGYAVDFGDSPDMSWFDVISYNLSQLLTL